MSCVLVTFAMCGLSYHQVRTTPADPFHETPLHEAPPQVLNLTALVSMTYFAVSGGPYG